MKQIYPVVLTLISSGWYAVHIPDLDLDTQGRTIADAIDMARDAISLWVCSEQDQGRLVSDPSLIHSIINKPGDIVTLVDVDISAYRRMYENRTVRKNLTLPCWLNDMSVKAGINFSQALQDALKERLGVESPKSIV